MHVPAVREHRTDRLTAPGSPAAALLSCFQLRTRTSGSWVGGPGPRLLRSPHSLLAPSYPRSSYWGTSLCLKGRGLTLALTLAPKGVKGTSLETPCLQLPWSRDVEREAALLTCPQPCGWRPAWPMAADEAPEAISAGKAAPVPQ